MAKSHLFTLKDIASRANVSLQTASNVLNSTRTPTRSDAVRRAEMIRQIAKEMNYRPHAAAQSMAMGRFGSLALLLSTTQSRSYLPSRMLDGIQDALAAHSLSLTVAKVPDERLRSVKYMPCILRNTMCDGLLIDYTDCIPDEMVRLIEQYEIPSVWLNTERDHCCIGPDELGGGRVAVRKLIEMGHRRIAYGDFTYAVSEHGRAHYSRRLRPQGYRQAMSQAGLTPIECMTDVGCVGDEVLRCAQALITRPDRPTAVLVYGGDEAAALLWTAAEHGLRVPQDLSVVVFTGDSCSFIGRPFTTVVSPHYDLGRSAVGMMLRILAEPTGHMPAELIPYTWSDGATVASVTM